MNTKEIVEQEQYILQLENIIRTLNYYGEHERKPFYEEQLKKHKKKFQDLLRERREQRK